MNPNATSRAPLVPALCWFAAANMLLLLFVFRGALWGGALLAPLDIPPALFTQYQYVQPAQPPVPANHHIIDAIYYDLPLQKTIYESYRRGEAPWWDPYSFAGRPLLADAHINGTDWVRVLCYRLLPFEAAYNWTRILHFLISGLGMLLLLRAFGFEAFVSVMLALTYEFAGGFACFFCHPWVQASFLFYPFLWLLWDAAWRTSLGWREGVAGVLAAGVFYSGNIQSHAYLPVFALAFCGGYAGRSRAGWGRALRIVAVSGLLGALLAAPVLLNEIEFYALGLHMTAPSPPLGLLAGAASLSGLYPWLLGTFRTLDVGRALGFSGLGFCVYIGSAAFVLALLALRAPLAAAFVARRRMAAWLVFFYFGLILSTPLRVALYTRSCGLALIALTVLAGLAVSHWPRAPATADSRGRRTAWLVFALAAAVVALTHLGAFVLYPHYQERIRAHVLKRDETNASMVQAPRLREAQLRNFPREVSFQNPETVLAVASLLALAAVLGSRRWSSGRWSWRGVLILNALPVFLFAQRFIPCHPIEMWHRLEAGGPEQLQVSRALSPEQRLFELPAPTQQRIFPGELQHLQKVHSVQGYSALQPRTFATLGLGDGSPQRAQLADWFYETATNHADAGTLRKNDTPGLARFQWRTNAARIIRVEAPGLNRLRLSFPPGATDALLWTDTHYPGWHAEAGGRELTISPTPPCFSVMQIPAGTTELVLFYRPSFLRIGLVLCLTGAGGVLLCVARERSRCENHSPLATAP